MMDGGLFVKKRAIRYPARIDGWKTERTARMAEVEGTVPAGRLTRIVTHDDFDGCVSAALCSVAEGIDDFRFSRPGSILDPGLEVTSETVVCDLPHHPAAGRWFDHHVGNFEDYCLKGGDPEAVRDTFGEEKSCARVVYRYYRERGVPFAEFMARTVEEADTIDSFDYRDLEDWRRETPGKILSDTLRVHFPSRGERNRYMRHLIRRIRGTPLQGILADPDVQEKSSLYREAEERSIALIERLASFLPEDEDQEVILLDTTGLKHAPSIFKSLAFLLYPEAAAVLEVKSLFRQNRKTNDLAISMSLSPCLELTSSAEDVGEIMRSLNVGDGHRGAGAGKIQAKSKAEMMKQKEQILQKILAMWRRQRPKRPGVPGERPSGRSRGMD
jgi:oligoribonuclease NrnB/cAMP/cGMP phosphodiesterase (DHH superfamily)